MGKRGLVDLHFHSRYSDGSESIAAIVEEAKRRGIAALALTDHNNGAGVPEFIAACKEADIVALEGVEIYAAFPETPWSWNPDYCGPVADVVILGKKLNWKELKGYQEMLAQYWLTCWLSETLKGLQTVGLKVPALTRDEMWEQLKDSGVPRVLHEVPKDPDNWQKLWEVCYSFDPTVKMEDIVKTPESPVQWANRHLYAVGKPAYVLRITREFTVKKAVELAEAMGGILFAAHPGGGYANWSDDHLAWFVEQGGKGIEVYQYWHTSAQIEKFTKYAEEYRLMVSGGSDWHGKKGRTTLGCWDKPSNQTPFEVFEELVEQLP